MYKKLTSLEISMQVLKLLEKTNLYGYQIISGLEKQSQQIFHLPKITEKRYLV